MPVRIADLVSQMTTQTPRTLKVEGSICPACGMQPRATNKDGSRRAYCKQCFSIKYKNRDHGSNPKRLSAVDR